MEFQHVPVLLQEVLDGLAIRPDGIYVIRMQLQRQPNGWRAILPPWCTIIMTKCRRF